MSTAKSHSCPLDGFQNNNESQQFGIGLPSIEQLDIGRFPNLYQNQDEFFRDITENNFEKIISNEPLEPEYLDQQQKQKKASTKIPKRSQNRYINTITFLNENQNRSFGPTRKYKKSTINPSCELFEKSLSRHIFQERKKWKDLKKLGISKFFVRMFMKYYEEYEISRETKEYNKRTVENVKEKSQNLYTIEKQLSQFLYLQLNQNPKKVSHQNRQILSQILRTKLTKEILFNRQISKNRMAYCIASKVYAIRCRSIRLCSKCSFK